MSKVNAVKKAMVAASDWLKKDGAPGFMESLSKTVKTIPQGIGTLLTGDPFIAASKIMAPGAKASSKDLGVFAISGLGLGYSTLNSVGNLVQDTKRLTNMANDTADFSTPISAAQNTMKMSAATTALTTIPVLSSVMNVFGKSVKGTKVAGWVGALGAGSGLLAKASNAVIKGGLFGGKVVGKAIDVPLKALTGKNLNFADTLGRQYSYIYGLQAYRKFYKWKNIDLTKGGSGALFSMTPGGQGIFIDNDPFSPTYMLPRALEAATKLRREENKTYGAPGEWIGGVMQKAFGTVMPQMAVA